MRSTLATLIIVWSISTPLAAQWLKEPTRDMPRNADGTPDLLAPAPRAARMGRRIFSWPVTFDVKVDFVPATEGRPQRGAEVIRVMARR